MDLHSKCILKIVSCLQPYTLTRNASFKIFTNNGETDYLIVKTVLNVKGFILIEIFFQSVLVALNGDINVRE